MQLKTTWQLGSSNPENAENLATIQKWWASLNGQEIYWQQRLLSATIPVPELNWEHQRFDETFLVTQPEIRGITLYWRKPQGTQERNTTPSKLALDTVQQQLYIYPQSQSEVVIRVQLPQVRYQTITLDNPQWEHQQTDTTQSLILRDTAQKLIVAVNFSPENFPHV
ncbi:hypothetical protein DO97_00895 [Neosynechococcus sphagnicola sy1]|uniref:Uncharacterized protein n=1 Tax=Neosynechococcus sphagnicola sy1 TaxID=1497020 RepID=A0A098TLS0_9CYAN|nr:hypothetical protein [Neosynechococcus sphagnicola]KGF73255.1 hypothetical protein DO97_00895 [Neosynechococcus sphagnicola sy1]